MTMRPRLLSFNRRSMNPTTDPELKNRVHNILSALYPHGISIERRRDTRYPYPHLIYLTPVADDSLTVTDETVVVAGKHLAEQGLSFYHPEPLPHRRMIASLEAGNGRYLGVLIDLSWCRFTRQGWYESGGKFLQIVQSPVKQVG